MKAVNFSKQLTFDLDKDDNLDLIEYFHLSRCAVMEVLNQRGRARSIIAAEVASVITTAMSKLDRRHGRVAWSSTITAYANVFDDAGRGKPVRSPKAILNLYPHVYESSLHRETLAALKKPRALAAGERLRQLIFDEKSRYLDFFDAYALCRAFVRHEVRAGLDGVPFDLRRTFAVISPVVEAFDDAIGKEWIERVEDVLDPNELRRISRRERIVRLFPVLRQLGLTSDAINALKQAAEPEKTAAGRWQPPADR